MSPDFPSGSTNRLDWKGFRRGSRAAIGIPGVIMSGSFLGFGALVAGAGLEVGHGLLMTLTMWALPAQVIFLEMYHRSDPALVIGFGVTLTSIRLMPMVISILPRARLGKKRRWIEYLAAHFIAVTIWVVSILNFDHMPRAQRLPYILGLGCTLLSGMLIMTTLGFFLVRELPPIFGAGLIFLTPSFFLLSLFAGARRRMDIFAIAAGAILGPVIMMIAPGFDLVAAGLIGGTLAFILGRKQERSDHES